MLNVGPQELIVILIIALLVVGPHRLPEVSRQLGRGLREFRKIQDDVKGMVNLDEVKSMVTFDADAPTPTSASTPTRSASRNPTRVSEATTTPSVHRAARPAPAPPAPGGPDPAQAPASPQDG
jgi:TatA/E family protein of Tat protein translocase